MIRVLCEVTEVRKTFLMEAMIDMVKITYKIKDIFLFYSVTSTELLLENCGTL